MRFAIVWEIHQQRVVEHRSRDEHGRRRGVDAEDLILVALVNDILVVIHGVLRRRCRGERTQEDRDGCKELRHTVHAMQQQCRGKGAPRVR